MNDRNGLTILKEMCSKRRQRNPFDSFSKFLDDFTGWLVARASSFNDKGNENVCIGNIVIV